MHRSFDGFPRHQPWGETPVLSECWGQYNVNAVTTCVHVLNVANRSVSIEDIVAGNDKDNILFYNRNI